MTSFIRHIGYHNVSDFDNHQHFTHIIKDMQELHALSRPLASRYTLDVNLWHAQTISFLEQFTGTINSVRTEPKLTVAPYASMAELHPSILYSTYYGLRLKMEYLFPAWYARMISSWHKNIFITDSLIRLRKKLLDQK